jgi:Rad3-related DNA helicase
MLHLAFGPRAVRSAYYADSNPPFFTIVNYEQVVTDTLDINARLAPDIVVLDEAQRIKNWATKTARAVKRLQSRYAFVLTGTPSMRNGKNTPPGSSPSRSSAPSPRRSPTAS